MTKSTVKPDLYTTLIDKLQALTHVTGSSLDLYGDANHLMRLEGESDSDFRSRLSAAVKLWHALPGVRRSVIGSDLFIGILKDSGQIDSEMKPGHVYAYTVNRAGFASVVLGIHPVSCEPVVSGGYMADIFEPLIKVRTSGVALPRLLSSDGYQQIVGDFRSVKIDRTEMFANYQGFRGRRAGETIEWYHTAVLRAEVAALAFELMADAHFLQSAITQACQECDVIPYVTYAGQVSPHNHYSTRVFAGTHFLVPLHYCDINTDKLKTSRFIDDQRGIPEYLLKTSDVFFTVETISDAISAMPYPTPALVETPVKLPHRGKKPSVTQEADPVEVMSLHQFMRDLPREMTQSDLEAFGRYLGARPRRDGESVYEYRALVEHASNARQAVRYFDVSGRLAFVDALITRKNIFDDTADMVKGMVYLARRKSDDNQWKVFTGTEPLNPDHYMEATGDQLDYSKFIVSDPRLNELSGILSDANSTDADVSLDDLLGQYVTHRARVDAREGELELAKDKHEQAKALLVACEDEIKARLAARGITITTP